MQETEIDARTAAAIAAGMQAVALADGEAHPREIAMIEQFRAELPADLDPSNVRITSDAVREVLVRSLLMVALADGRISDEERVVIGEVAQAHGASPASIAELEAAVKAEMMGMFAEVRVFKDEVAQIAKDLGVDDG